MIVTLTSSESTQTGSTASTVTSCSVSACRTPLAAFPCVVCKELQRGRYHGPSPPMMAGVNSKDRDCADGSATKLSECTISGSSKSLTCNLVWRLQAPDAVAVSLEKPAPALPTVCLC